MLKSNRDLSNDRFDRIVRFGTTLIAVVAGLVLLIDQLVRIIR
jgi:hypothetical protein